MTTPGPDELDAAALTPRRLVTGPDDGLNPSIPHVIAAGTGDEQPSRVTYRPAPTAQPPLDGDELDDAVRLVEDAIDATSSCGVTTDRTGQAIVDALLEAGWQPPDDIAAHAVLHDGHVLVVTREHPGTFKAPGFTVRPLTFRRVW